MIDFNKPFIIYGSKPKSKYKLVGIYHGLSCYEDIDYGNLFVIDILSLRDATVQVNRNTITVNGAQATIPAKYVQFGYIISNGNQYNRQDLNPGDTVKTISNERNVSLPILATKGEGGIEVRGVAGPYFVNGAYYYPADAKEVYRYKGYLLVPFVTSATQTTRDLSINDLEIAPEQPPQSDFLPNLFQNIKSGTHADTYIKDNDHKINIRLTHTSSHG